MPNCRNFTTANNNRRLQAAAVTCGRVAEALQLLAGDGPAHLLAVGRLRLEHPQASLAELAAAADPPLTKDTLSGRMRRLLALGEDKARRVSCI